MYCTRSAHTETPPFLSFSRPQAIPLFLLSIPLYAVVKLDSSSSKTVQGAANGQVHLASANALDALKVLQVSSASCVGDGNGAPFGQAAHEVFVDALLEALVVGCMYQELAAVGLQQLDGF